MNASSAKRLVFLVFCLVTVLTYAQPKKLTLATYTYADNNRLQNIQPLASALSRELGLPVDIKSYPNVSAFIQGLEAGEVDIALISTFGYLLLTNRNDQQYIPVAALQTASSTRDNYKTALIARKSLPIDNLTQLKDRSALYRMTFVSETSTSGNLIPRAFLYGSGITQPEKQFKQVTYSKTHAAAVQQVIDGQTDLAAFGSEEYYKAIHRDSLATRQVKLIWLSGEIPLGPVLLKKSISVPVQKKIQQVLLTLHQQYPGALISLRSGWSEAKQAERFRPIDMAFYHAYQREIGAPRELIESFANLIR
ncbi:hypothetical protein GCM10023189_59480 [Nibrella saemangeumensis]|uniref:Phosphate/phosphite/phosphonate ABC transporter binding protein n=1 Tax=Nibrella saemangeumensis TaxID=1084526 RepID=A0ABP8NSH7_9BACT